MTEICPETLCTGCGCCLQICPVQAISMRENEYGVTFPLIDPRKCIDCKKCARTCPANHPPTVQIPQKCYAAWMKPEQNNENSSSGGIAYGFSKAVIEKNGVVFGAAFDGILHLRHCAVKDTALLDALCGSKYTQSHIENTFLQAENELKTGKIVLFTGTPCQIAGLKSFLGKEYCNLYTIDLICHGVPPQKYLQEHLIELRGKTTLVHPCLRFRTQKGQVLEYTDGTKVLYRTRAAFDEYFTAFLLALSNRSNCYTCPYASEKRTADVTIGDFWGLQRETLRQNPPKNVSVVLLNTPQGQRLWELGRERFIFDEREVEEAVAGNSQLRAPSVPHPEREVFLRNYPRKGFSAAIRNTSIPRLILRRRIAKVIAFPLHVISKIIR